ncbi:hypothetical protein [Haemophilus haemolyticus]|uniref:Uncharacterized protein n=1 Tax=Haemophilus haemolyticus TaxID=726 RepID=A0A852PN51_HAEHA|nr:hypothetical protein [Haemophilus haemolyticus]NYA27794.1 hypothetical protein [Haemophilus haemolyticus]
MVQEEIAAIKTDITTESAPSQSGKLENRLIETSWVTIPLECGKFLRCFLCEIFRDPYHNIL